jgi:hypothetical protein
VPRLASEPVKEPFEVRQRRMARCLAQFLTATLAHLLSQVFLESDSRFDDLYSHLQKQTAARAARHMDAVLGG